MQNEIDTHDEDQQTSEMAQHDVHSHSESQETQQNPFAQEPQSDFSHGAEAEASAPKKEKRETPNNSGSMFKNDRKSKSEHPDITGSAMVGGVEYYVSGWRRSGTKGDFYSLSFRLKDQPATASELI